MKILRILAVAIVAICFFGRADAQVVVRARIGTPPPRQHRVIVAHRPYHREVVVARRPVYHHRYDRHRYHGHRNTVVVRP